jgi:glutamine amidotransferase
MAAPSVVVLRTGTANLASVLAGLRRAGGAPRLCESPDEITVATHVVLPGVGAFAAAMERLRAAACVAPLVARLRAGRPTLCVCLGLQLLCEHSEESPGVPGLGVIPGTATRFPDTVRVPQFGWNRVTADPGCRLLDSGHAYFANSYRLAAAPPDWHVALTDHGGPFVAACERGRVLACQFHPELSGPWGLALLQRWLTGGAPC